MSSFESWRFKRFAPLLKFSKELSAFSTSFENVSSRQIQVFFPGYPHLFLKRIPEGSVCCLMDDAQFSKAGHDVHPAYAQINLLQRKRVEIGQPGFHKCIKHIIIYCIPGLFFFLFSVLGLPNSCFRFVYASFPKGVPSGERDMCKDFLSILHIFRASSKAGWKREVLPCRNSYIFS